MLSNVQDMGDRFGATGHEIERIVGKLSDIQDMQVGGCETHELRTYPGKLSEATPCRLAFIFALPFSFVLLPFLLSHFHEYLSRFILAPRAVFTPIGFWQPC